MIKFIPKKSPTKGNLISDPEGNINNIGSNKLAIQMNNRFVGRGCDKHPSVDSVLIVDLAKLQTDFIQIESYCCDDFKREVLDLILQNKDPYSGK